MVSLPGGGFRMGSAEFRPPVHRVQVSPFAIGATEVTNRQYDALVKGHRRPAESKGDAMPVTGLTYKEAARYAALLSKREGRRYRLPTDAEWEYAARGGLEGQPFPWGGDDSTMPANTAVKGLRRGCEPVMTYGPNAYGLYDTVGNVDEYVRDSEEEFDPSIAATVQVNPLHDQHKDRNLAAGGAYDDPYPFVWFRRTILDDFTPDILVDVGFRLVREGV